MHPLHTSPRRSFCTRRGRSLDGKMTRQRDQRPQYLKHTFVKLERAAQARFAMRTCADIDRLFADDAGVEGVLPFRYGHTSLRPRGQNWGFSLRASLIVLE